MSSIRFVPAAGYSKQLFSKVAAAGSNASFVKYINYPTNTITTSFTYTGSLQSLYVPSDVTSITVYMWGAGGGNGSAGTAGGAGAYITGNLPVTPNTTLSILVGSGGSTTLGGAGAGGNAGVGGSGGSGGGRSAIIYSSADLVSVGGGGGAGSSGTTNFAGVAASYTATPSSANPLTGNTGSSLQGGTGTTSVSGVSRSQGGGGGGGYIGGDGGGSTAFSGGATASGGGGGSSYTTNLTNFTGVNGSGASPPGTGVAGYITGVAAGGSGAGLVIISYTVVVK